MESASDTLTIKLWPPSESIRQRCVERMTTQLSTESILCTQEGGLFSKGTARKVAKYIEENCLAIANEQFAKDNDPSSALSLYGDESSKRMLEFLNRDPRDSSSAVNPFETLLSAGVAFSEAEALSAATMNELKNEGAVPSPEALWNVQVLLNELGLGEETAEGCQDVVEPLDETEEETQRQEVAAEDEGGA